MKNIFFAALFVGLLSFSGAFAQNEVTNEELYRYAIVMETKDLFQNELSAQITEYVEKQDPAIKNRYNALQGVKHLQTMPKRNLSVKLTA